ncbi:MAG: hypothetical protein KUG82_21130, partial [Pseudomonadales bacterium]|nr:hypothetical protein [Pseudomonadales bacterium]
EPTWADFWKSLDVQFHDDSDKKNISSLPDITCWFTDQLVLSDESYRTLSETLSAYGEFLPVQYKDICFWVFHVTKLTGLDFINQTHSKRTVEASGNIDVEKMSFISDKVKDLLVFKTEYNGFKNIYCSDEFKTLIENAGLEGLVFNEDLASVF